ncbi:MAG: type VII secretion protein EssB [Culicoidibacterales bacterium]
MRKNIFKHNGEEKIIRRLKLNTLSVELEEVSKDMYIYTFQKSLSNIRTESELLPLVADVPGLSDSKYEIENDLITLTYYTRPNSVAFVQYEQKLLHEQLHVLKNIGNLYTSHLKGYTHLLHPNNLYVDDNNIPYVLYRGYVDVMEPLEQVEGDLVRQYQALVFSLFDLKYDFESLYDGALEFVKKTSFLEKVYNAQTMQELQDVIAISYHQEKERYERNHIAILKNRYRVFQNTGILAMILAVIMVIPLSWMLLAKGPFDDKMATASGYYAAERYGDVVSTLSRENVNVLPLAQKYMLARSYLELEPMSNQNKTSAKKSLTYDSDPRVFQFWISLGRDDYKMALDVAKSMNIDAYGYVASFKAVEIIKRSTGSGEQKERDLKIYEDEVRKYEEKIKLSSTS